MEFIEALMRVKKDLDKQYSPMLWSHRFDPNQVVLNFFEVTAKTSALAKETIPCDLNIGYSDTGAQKIDIYGAKSLPEDAPIFTFVHGGYWIAGSRDDSGGCALPLYKAGIVSAVLGYDYVSEKISVTDIVKEIGRGFTFVLDYAIKRKSKGVYLCGHSAGAHLITMALSSISLNENQKSMIKGVIAISGVYDIEPIRGCEINEGTRITEDVARESSPMKFVDKIAENLGSLTKVLIVVADNESLAFKTQSKQYEQSLKAKGMNSEYCLVMDEDHFSIIEKLAEDDYFLVKKIIELVGSK